MSQLSKLQIRAKVLSVISEIKSLQYRNEEALSRLIKELEDIEDKEAMFDIFLKEFIKLEEDDYNFCACILKSIVNVQYITEKALENLKSSTLSDECKYKIVQLLRITGGDYNYSELPQYFDNPQEVMDLETKRLLDSAVFNPESMLDFLDFVSAVSARDRSILLKSLNLDYSGDALANIVYPILYADFDDEFILQAINVLIEAKSSLAIAPFEYLIQVSSNEEIVNTCKTGLKKLKLAGATKEKADEYFKSIVKNSTPSQFFATIPDGSGKQALLITRGHENGKFSLAAVVISDSIGIVDCFGFFNISNEEISRVIKKFYQSEGRYSVPEEYVKWRIETAEALTVKNKLPYPYEYICWNPIIKDILNLKQSIFDYVDEKCEIQEISKATAALILTLDYTLRWFLTPSDNELIKEITQKIYEYEDVPISEINEILRTNTDILFNEEITKIWIDRFYNLIYILRKNKKLKEADAFYTLLKDEKLFIMFKQVIMQRSIFNYFVALRENAANTTFATNIFRKRNNAEQKYDTKKLEKIIITMKRSWLDK